MQMLQAERDALLKPLLTVTGIVERRHTMPILSNVFIRKQNDELSFIATDLEIQINSIQQQGFEGKDFTSTVSAKKLQDILRAIPDHSVVELHEEAGKIIVRAGKSKFSLQTLPADSFPQLSIDSNVKTVLRLPQKQLKALLSRVQYAMAQQDIRYYLNGLLLVLNGTQLTLAATDGHRLSVVGMALDNEYEKNEAILPRKTVLELFKLLTDSEDEVEISLASSQVRFRFGHLDIYSKLIDGRFPDYNRAIPENNRNTFSMDRQTFLQALQRAAILSHEKFRAVRIILMNGLMRVACNNNEQEEAQEELEIDYAGDQVDIAFNVSYLLDLLTNCHEDTIHFAFGDANSSLLITIPELAEFKYVVMPMRI
jgi:DNA polymerase-3 subunit beta